MLILFVYIGVDACLGCVGYLVMLVLANVGQVVVFVILSC